MTVESAIAKATSPQSIATGLVTSLLGAALNIPTPITGLIGAGRFALDAFDVDVDSSQDPKGTSDLSMDEEGKISGMYTQSLPEGETGLNAFYQNEEESISFLSRANPTQMISHPAFGLISIGELNGIRSNPNFDPSVGNLSPSPTSPAQAEYEAAVNAMEFPANAPVSTPNYAPNAVSAISTLSGIGSGLLGGLQGKDEFGVYGQASDFAPDSTSNAQAEAESAMEGLGTTDVSTGPSNEAFAEAMETPGLLGTVESLPTTVASVSSVDDPAAVSGGFPGATPGFNSISYHSMGMDAFNAMANSSDANSMAGRTGNAYNSFAYDYGKANPGMGDKGLGKAWQTAQDNGTIGYHQDDTSTETGLDTGTSTARGEYEAAANAMDQGDSDGDAGACFLTTAACEVLGKPDDCIELQTFRKVRDNLFNHPIAKWLIRKYYREAPLGAELLRKHPNKEKISTTMFSKYIPKVMVALEKGQTWKAILLYWAMSRYVKKGVL